MKAALNISGEERHKVTSNFTKATPDEPAPAVAKMAMAGRHRHKAGQAREIITLSPEETKQFAAGLARELKPGSVLALHGDLGSGKTCFVQGLAEALGVNEIVNSPTFAIINEYRGRVRFYHVDLYRIKSGEEAEALGMDEFLGTEGITAMEWPEVFSRFLPGNTIHVYFEFVDSNRRRISLPVSRE